MNDDLLRGNVTPAEGEMSVRVYRCSYYKSRLIGLEATGYLAVTNKRVIFRAQGKSSSGLSVIQSEVPVADISGITSYNGTYFSLGHLLGALVVAAFVYALMPTLLTLLASSADMSFDTYRGIIWFVAVGSAIGSFFVPNKLIWRTALAAASAGVLSILAGSSLVSSFLGGYGRNSGWEMLVVGALVIYTFVCVGLYSRRPTFSLSIGSKGGSSTPINISGATGIGIFDVAAGKALTAEPAEQAETMLKELGALVLDIQTLGDYGINKWKQS